VKLTDPRHSVEIQLKTLMPLGMATMNVRNEKIVNGVVETGARFWKDNVLAHVPPPAVTLADVYKLLARRKDTDVQASVNCMALYADLLSQKRLSTQTEKRIEELQIAIGREMLGAAVETKELANRHRLMLGKEVLMTVSASSRRSVSVEDLLTAAPELERLVNTSKFLTFRIPRAK